MNSTPEANCELLSAWLDGEPTEPAAVDAALATSEGRAFVVDAMSLRRMVGVTAVPAARAESAAVARRPAWIAAAAAAVVCLGAGYGLARVTTPDAPDAAAVETTTVISADAPSAPQPTHVIRFESGVDWRETSGGN